MLVTVVPILTVCITLLAAALRYLDALVRLRDKTPINTTNPTITINWLDPI